MGGCRCTYKNCTVRSDGKTHLFHYPVFDKIRCHEWLSKAGRYDFLNLKVSQLKNRCICQHHFTDDWFMNDNKEKLKLKAVPTLDGPYCDSSKFKDPEMPQNMLGLYPLACEVVENDDFILDRKSNYNVVYADFLTNCDGIEPYNDCSENLNITQVSHNWTNIENVTPATNNNIKEVGYKLRNSNKSKINCKPKNNLVIQNPPPSSTNLEFEVPLLPVEQNTAEDTKDIKIEVPLPLEKNNANVSHTSALPDNQKKRSKVRIISEKKITEPGKKICVPVSAASFEVVKPSMILSISKNRGRSKAINDLPQPDNTKEDPIVLNNADKSIANEMVVTSSNEKEEPIMLNNTVNSCQDMGNNITELLGSNDPRKFKFKIDLHEGNPPAKRITNQKKTILNKMPPERVAAINEKRKFNMKLKDIIAEELNRLDEQNSADRDTLVPKKQRINNKEGKDTVLSSLSAEPSLPNEHAYIVHYLEARMERMENLLLNKIDQNTQKIMDLKRTLDAQVENLPESKILSMKKNISDDAHKKQLYTEISKYLTPNSNSLIYEELFINQYDPNESNTSTKRRRKRR